MNLVTNKLRLKVWKMLGNKPIYVEVQDELEAYEFFINTGAIVDLTLLEVQNDKGAWIDYVNSNEEEWIDIIMYFDKKDKNECLLKRQYRLIKKLMEETPYGDLWNHLSENHIAILKLINHFDKDFVS